MTPNGRHGFAPEESTVMRLRDTNPEFVPPKGALRLPYDKTSPSMPSGSATKKKAAEAAGGTAYWDSILDKMNIETCLANRWRWPPTSIPSGFIGFFVDSFLLFRQHNLIPRTGPGRIRPRRNKVCSVYLKQESMNGHPRSSGYEAPSPNARGHQKKAEWP